MIKKQYKSLGKKALRFAGLPGMAVSAGDVCQGCV